MGGLNGLSLKDQERVKIGNRLARRVIHILKLCKKHGVPIIIENPLTSRLWILPPLLALISSCTSDVTFDHCQYGGDAKKPTRLIGWNIDLSRLALRCVQRNGLCSKTQKPHVQLSGIGPNKEFRTAGASAYPMPLCTAFASLLAGTLLQRT